MALSATFAADFSKFQEACTKAEVSLKGIETGAGKVGTQLDRMANSLSGTKIIQQATVMAEAVQRVGGVSTLTARELERVGATAVEAAAKLKALGQDIPPGIQKIADAAVRARKELENTAGIDKLIGSVKTLASAFGIAFGATAVIGGIKNLIGGALDMADALDDTSKQLGVSAEKLQGWVAAAQLGNATAEDVSTAIGKMNVNLDTGSKQTVTALKALGLEFHAIRGLNVSEQFETIVTAIMKIPDPADRARAAVELFGKGGQSLLPAIADDMVKVGNAATKMDNETVKSLAEAKEAWETFGRTVTIATGKMLAGVIHDFSLLNKNLKYLWADITQPGQGAGQAMAAADRAAAALAETQNKVAEATARAAGFSRKSADELAAEADALKKAATASEQFASDTADREAALARINEVMGDQAGRIDLTVGEWAKLALAAGGGALSVGDIAKATGLATEQLDLYKKAITAAAAEQDKFNRDMETSADRTAALMADTTAQQLKASTDILGAKLADIDTWVTTQIQAENKLKTSDQAYVAFLVALLQNAEAKRTAAFAEGEVAHQKALDTQRAAEEKSAQATVALWDKYQATIERNQGENVRTRIAAVQRQAARQVEAVADGLAKELAIIHHNNDLEDKDKEFFSKKAIARAQSQTEAIVANAKIESKAIKDAFTADWMGIGAQAISDIAKGFQSGQGAAGIGQASQMISAQLIAGMKGSLKDKAGIAIGQAIGEAVGGQNVGEQIGSVIGLAAGAAFAGPLGAAVGSAVGGAVGGIVDRLHQSHQIANAAKDVGNEMGVSLTQGLATGIANTAENIQKMDASLSAATARHYAELLQLDKIIVEQGGLTASNMTQWAGQAERLFEVIKRGGELGQAATQELSNIMETFAAQAEKGSGLWDDAFKTLIADAQQAGVDVEKINKLLLDQSQKGAANIGAAAKITSDAYAKEHKDKEDIAGLTAKLADQQVLDLAKINDLKAKMAGADAEHAAAYAQQISDIVRKEGDLALDTSLVSQIDALNKDLLIQQGIIQATAITSQGAADAMASAIEGGIAASMAAGQSFVQAVLGQKDAVNALATDMEKAGFTGGAAWDFIKGQVDLATDAIAGPALQALEANTAGIVALSNAGQLSAGQFQALEERIGATATALESQGKSSDQVMAAMQGDLQVAWELENKYGVKLDETTQKLVDQAEEAGTVGEAHKSANDQMIDGINRLVDHLDLLLKKFGIDIPKAMQGTAGAAQQAAGDTQRAWDGLDIQVPIEFQYHTTGTLPDMTGSASVGGSGGPEAPSFAREGFVSKPTLAKIGDYPGGEYILHKATVDRLMAAAASGGSYQPASMLTPNAGIGLMSEQPIIVTVQPIESSVTLDSVEVGRVWMRLGAKEVMRRGKSRR